MLNIRPEVWQNITSTFVAICGLCGGVWALYIYYKSKRTSAAQWLYNLYKDFYFDNKFRVIRYLLENSYNNNIENIIIKCNNDIENRSNQTERKIIFLLDNFLNYLEYIAYLEIHGHLRKKDRLCLFNYWFSIINQPSYIELKKYIIKYQYNQILSILNKK